MTGNYVNPFDEESAPAADADPVPDTSPGPAHRSPPRLKERDEPAATTIDTQVEAIRRKRRLRAIGRFVAIVLILGAVIVGSAAAVANLDLGDPEETARWETARNALERLQADSADNGAWRDVVSVLGDVEDTQANRDARAGLSTVFALGALHSGASAKGLDARANVREHYATTEFAVLLDDEALFEACPECKGSGTLPEDCDFCGGKGKCPSCNGTGTKSRTQSNLLGGGAGRLQSPDSVKRLGSSSSKKLGSSSSRTITQTVRCPVCRGSGKCPRCEGERRKSVPCTTCHETGQVLSPEAVAAQLDTALSKSLTRIGLRVQKSGMHEQLLALQSKIRDWAPALYRQPHPAGS